LTLLAALALVGCKADEPRRLGAVQFTGPKETRIRDLRIVAIGDSHTNGHVTVATDSTSGPFGTWGLTGPFDWQWNGTAFNGGTSSTPFRADSQIASGNQDLNASVTTGVQSWLSFLPQVLRNYPSVRNVYLANFGVSGASTYTWSGNLAQGYVDCSVIPNDGDTVTVCGQAYRFKTTGTQAFDVTIGANVTASATNLTNAINGESTGWFAGTTPNANCFCPLAFGSEGPFVVVNSNLTGTAGNSQQIASSNLLRCFATNNASPGTPLSPANLLNGSASSIWWTNALTTLAAGPGFGTPDIVLLYLGTNDCIRAGYRGANFTSEMTTLVANVHTQWPSAKIVLWKPPQLSLPSPEPACLTTLVASVATIAGAQGYTSFVDVYNFPSSGVTATNIISGDTVHLTSYAYQMVAQVTGAKIGALMNLQ
jgi:hypothetical protein